MSFKKLLRLLFIVFILTVLSGSIAFYVLDKPLPKKIESEEADQMAHRMLAATHYEHWEKTGLVRWSFAHSHHFLWDRKRDFVQVEWNDAKVLLDTKKLSRSIAYQNDILVENDTKSDLINTAWEYFCNDSFWLCAHYKVFDEGTKRYLTDNDELMIQYESGGVTPGDSYVWQLDESSKPTSFQMWVQIIPIGGLKADWSALTETETGAILPLEHSFGPISFSIDNIFTATSVREVMNEDPFEALN